MPTKRTKQRQLNHDPGEAGPWSVERSTRPNYFLTEQAETAFMNGQIRCSDSKNVSPHTGLGVNRVIARVEMTGEIHEPANGYSSRRQPDRRIASEAALAGRPSRQGSTMWPPPTR